MFNLDPTIRRATFPFQSHASQPHTVPAVQFTELVAALRERCREVTRHSAYDRIEFLDFAGIQIMTADGQFSDPGLEFLHGFCTHLDRVARHVETEKGKTLSERRDVRFLGAERQVELFHEQLDRPPCLPRLVLCLAEHDEVIGIPHEAITLLLEVPVEEVQCNVRQQWRQRPSNDIANSGGLLDRLIPRNRLRTAYGEGWKSP
jgi:hypothetical protein